LFANVAVTQGLVIVVLVAAALYFEIPARGFGVSVTGPAILLGVAFGAVLWIGNELSTTVADAVGASYDEGVREMMAPESTGGWLVLFVFVLPIIAIAEELLFRGALIGVPAAGFGVSPWLLAVVASLAFALGHGAQGRVGIVVTGVLGFVLAAGYIVSGSLLVVIVAHYLINGLEFFVHEYLGVEAVFGRLASS
ncbi:MAG: CPBP family intramembrane glutamic endopeptidase, partial [Halovenus sp.]